MTDHRDGKYDSPKTTLAKLAAAQEGREPRRGAYVQWDNSARSHLEAIRRLSSTNRVVLAHCRFLERKLDAELAGWERAVTLERDMLNLLERKLAEMGKRWLEEASTAAHSRRWALEACARELAELLAEQPSMAKESRHDRP